MEERISQGWEKAKTQVEVTPEEGAELPAEAAVDEPPAEVVPEGEPAAEEPAADGAAQPAAALDDDIDDGSTLAPDAFSKAIKGTEVEKWLDANPKEKNLLYGALRRDNENRELREIVPDVATAREMSQSASYYSVLDRGFMEATTPEGVGNFLQKWAQMAVQTDENGQPVKGADGKYVFEPSFPFILNQIYENKLGVEIENAKASGKIAGGLAKTVGSVLDIIGAQAKQSQDESLQAALEILRERIPATSQAQEDDTPELKAARENLNTREQEISRREGAAAEAVIRQSVDRSEQKASVPLLSQLERLVKRAGLPEAHQQAFYQKTGKMVDDYLASHPWYQSRYDGLEARIKAAKTDEARAEVEKELTGHIVQYSTPVIGKFGAQVLRELQQPAVESQDARDTKVATQQRTSRTDPRGTSVSVAAGAQPQNEKQAIAVAKADWAKAHPDNPDMPLSELMQVGMRWANRKIGR